MTAPIMHFAALSALLRIFAAWASGEFTDHQTVFAFVVTIGGMAGVNIWYANTLTAGALAAGYYDLIELGPQTWTAGIAAKGLGAAAAGAVVIYVIVIRWPFLFAPTVLASALYLTWESAHILQMTDQAPSLEYLINDGLPNLEAAV